MADQAFSINFPKVVLFGDSITQFSFDVNNGAWGAILADKLQRKCDVVNRGFSGYNTKLCDLIMPSLFQQDTVTDIAVFVIFLGANDACFENGRSRQHVPLEMFKQYLQNMCQYMISIGVEKEKLLLITPPAYDYDAHAESCKLENTSPDRSNEMARLYSLACEDVGKSMQVDVLNLHAAMMNEKKWKCFLLDGLHLSKEGGTFLAEILWPYIEKRTNHLKEILPKWAVAVSDPDNVLHLPWQ